MESKAVELDPLLGINYGNLAMAYYIFKDYDWYNYENETFDTEITNTFGGTLEENVTNPETNGINTSAKVGKITKASGVNSQIRFNLNVPINNLSNFKQKLQIDIIRIYFGKCNVFFSILF